MVGQGESGVEVGAHGSASLTSSAQEGESPEDMAKKWSSQIRSQVSSLFCTRASQTNSHYSILHTRLREVKLYDQEIKPSLSDSSRRNTRSPGSRGGTSIEGGPARSKPMEQTHSSLNPQILRFHFGPPPGLGHLLREGLVGPQHGVGLQVLIYVLPVGPVVLDLKVGRRRVKAVPLWGLGWG